MIKTIKKLVFPILALLSLGFILFLINQVSGIYLLASDIHPILGKVVLAALILVIGVLFLTPFLIFFRLPGSIRFPEKESELPAYRQKLVKRLRNNTILLTENQLPTSTEDLPESIDFLNKKSDEIIGQTASIVFLTTSVSQNGKLDAFTVFITQVRMVWKVAHIYFQRPSPKQLLYLYSNVGASSFLASEIEDMDLTRQIEPILNALFKNASGRSVPVLGNATQVILDSIMEGSTNAFLTLRVGILAKKYCGQLDVVDHKQLKKEALKEAANQLRVITMKSSGKLMSSIVSATKNASWERMKSSWEGVKNTGSRVKDGIKTTSEKINPFKKAKKEDPID